MKAQKNEKSGCYKLIRFERDLCGSEQGPVADFVEHDDGP